MSAKQNDDNDSTLGDESGSELNYGSVTSSIYNYRQENGRTYHAVCCDSQIMIEWKLRM